MFIIFEASTYTFAVNSTIIQVLVFHFIIFSILQSWEKYFIFIITLRLLDKSSQFHRFSYFLSTNYFCNPIDDGFFYKFSGRASSSLIRCAWERSTPGSFRPCESISAANTKPRWVKRETSPSTVCRHAVPRSPYSQISSIADSSSFSTSNPSSR